MYNLIKKTFRLENEARVQIFFPTIGKFPLSYKKKKERKNIESRKLESKVSLFSKTKQKER